MIRWLACIAKLGRNAWHAWEIQVFSLFGRDRKLESQDVAEMGGNQTNAGAFSVAWFVLKQMNLSKMFFPVLALNVNAFVVT